MKIIFTKHGQYTLSKRKISYEEISYTLKYPDRIIKKFGAYFYQKKLPRGNIEIVCERTGAVENLRLHNLR